jgi:hypothetical protein
VALSRAFFRALREHELPTTSAHEPLEGVVAASGRGMPRGGRGGRPHGRDAARDSLPRPAGRRHVTNAAEKTSAFGAATEDEQQVRAARIRDDGRLVPLGDKAKAGARRCYQPLPLTRANGCTR